MQNVFNIVRSALAHTPYRESALVPRYAFAMHNATYNGARLTMYEILSEANAIIARCSYAGQPRPQSPRPRISGGKVFLLCCAAIVPALAYCVYRVLSGLSMLW